MVHAIGDLVKSITIAVGAGFYPARAECTIKIARISAHSYHVAADFCIRDCLPPGGVEPRPYAYVVIPADSHWCIRICNTMPHNPFVTASPCHLPLHKGGLVQCKRGGAVETCKKRAGQALPLRYDKSFTSSSLGSRLRSRTLRGSLFRAG